ncbi:MAG: hypothetical protein MJ106_01310 [Lentisphaeria bacterium]|nr:hypothetical protein [Lentisphaeria bacterium]
MKKTIILSLLMISMSIFCADAIRLNEQVQRLVASSNEFTVPVDTWVYLSAPPSRIFSSDGTCIAEKNAFIDNKEWIGFLPAGKYTLENLPQDTEISANSIPELYFYAPGINNMPDIEGFYDWPELGKELLRSTTTLSIGHMDWKSLDIYRKHNRLILNNFGVLGLEREDYPQILKDYFAKNRTMTDKFYDGFSLDEYNICSGDQAPLVRVTEFLRQLENPDKRPMRIWTYGDGRFEDTPERRAFLETCCNGVSKIMMELYLSTPLTQEEAQKAIERRFLGFIRSIRKSAPQRVDHVGIVPGSFNQITEITLEHFPNIDFRYFLDMQMNLLANSEEMRGLGLIGYWGCNYVDEDLQRWGLELMRHYFVEGNKDMLSDKFGFTYKMDFLQNGDFRNGLEGWTTDPAPDGAIFQGNGVQERFAETSIERWGELYDGYAMNCFAVMRKGTSGENRLTQVLKGLVPGQEYMLNYVTTNYYELKTDQRRPHATGIHAEFDAAQVDAQPERVHVDRNVTRSSGAGRVNLHRVYFTPKTDEATLTITDRDSNGIPGEELGITFVQIKKCFPGRTN